MAKPIPESRAIALIHDQDRCLAKMHTVRGPRWFIVPDGEVSSATAARIRKIPNVVAAKDALFPASPKPGGFDLAENVAVRHAAGRPRNARKGR
jgi:hypothetical protein